MRKLICFAFTLASFSATTFPAEWHIAFEHSNAVYVANFDETHEKKIAARELPAIPADGTRVAFNTDEDSKTRPGQNVTSQSRSRYEQSHNFKADSERQGLRAGLSPDDSGLG